jgi:hypothetical protein
MSLLRVRRKRGVVPRNRAKRSEDADDTIAMEGESTVDKLQGMSLRDQDESDDDSSSRLTPEAEAQEVVALSFHSDRSDADQDDTADKGTNSQTAARSGLRPPALPTPESAAIAAKRAQLQAALRDRPRWMARPAPEPAPVDSVPEIELEAVDETPVELSEATLPEELPEDTSDSAIIPYSPPDWKAVFGTLEEAAENESDSDRGTEEAETVESADAMVLPEPDDLPYASDEPVAEAAAEPAYVDLTFDVDEPEEVPAESAEADLASDDDEPQHVFAEPPVLFESPAAQEARRRFRAAYELYRAPQAIAVRDAAEGSAANQQEDDGSAYPSGHEHRDYFGGYEEAAPFAALAEDPHYARPPVSHEINPPSEALRRAANVAQSRYGAPIRAPMRRPQPFEGASPNMREALDSLNSRGRVARRDTVRRTVAKQRQTNRTMSGVAVAAALLMSACGGLGIYAWKSGGLDAVLGLLPSSSSETRVQQAAMTPEAGFEETATTKPPAAAEEGSEQQPGEENDGPVVVEATPTPEGSNVEGPTGALPEANKETPAEHMPPPAAEPPPLPEAPAGAAATPAAPPQAEPAKEPAKAQSTMGKATKKRFHTARLSVADVEGVEQQSIPLNLSMDTGEGTGEVQLRLSGLPETASLSAGQKLADGAWVVTAKDASDLKLLTPDIQKAEHHTVAVEAVETKTGSLAAPTQEMQLSIVPRNVIVEPAAASTDNKPAPSQGGQSQAMIQMPPAKPAAVPPPVTAEPPVTTEPPVTAEPPVMAKPPVTAKPAPALAPEKPAAAEKPAKLPKLASLNAEPEVAMPKPAPAPAAEPSEGDDDLIARGDELLSLGDIVAARQLYEFAFDRGQMQAAVALGRTYDPVTFEKLKVRGLTPNPQAALEWYKKAEKAGVKGAQADIEALSAWLAR